MNDVWWNERTPAEPSKGGGRGFLNRLPLSVLHQRTPLVRRVSFTKTSWLRFSFLFPVKKKQPSRMTPRHSRTGCLEGGSLHPFDNTVSKHTSPVGSVCFWEGRTRPPPAEGTSGALVGSRAKKGGAHRSTPLTPCCHATARPGSGCNAKVPQPTERVPIRAGARRLRGSSGERLPERRREGSLSRRC